MTLTLEHLRKQGIQWQSIMVHMAFENIRLSYAIRLKMEYRARTDTDACP